MELNEKIRQLPAAPGVYLMLDGDGKVIYVGKSRSLRQRVQSYFRGAGDGRHHIRFLMARVADLQVIITDTEKEALLLENTLIKQHRPRYNLDLKDDKNYFSLRIDPREEYPRFTIIRKVTADGARYFGPYSSAAAARQVLQQITRMFPLRHYPLAVCMGRPRPCLYHQIGQCCAPCSRLVSADDYMSLVQGAMLFLEGKGRELVSGFRRRMNEAAAALRFEEAARWRNLLRSVEVTVEKQNVISRGGDSDVLGYVRENDRLDLALLFVRGGVLTGSRNFSLKWELDDAGGIAAFLQQYYGEGRLLPDEILLPVAVEESLLLEELLSEQRGKRVSVLTPRRGAKAQMTGLAMKNAAAAARQKADREDVNRRMLEELMSRLHLERLPRRIECYDISTIQGRQAVGSGVVFLDGAPDRKHYRRYKIRSVEGQDDFAMLSEVLGRRFREDRCESEDMPDLVVVDGGIGQLNAVRETLRSHGLEGRFDLISLAKSRTARDAAGTDIEKSAERVFLPGRKNPVVLKQNSPALLLLAAIRDEAHRFAIEYHRTLRGKQATSSGLDVLPGIGPRRRTALLQHFGSLQRVMEAAVDEIAAVPGIGRAAAEKLFQELHRDS